MKKVSELVSFALQEMTDASKKVLHDNILVMLKYKKVLKREQVVPCFIDKNTDYIRVFHFEINAILK